jgi:serine/threonine protein kinase
MDCRARPLGGPFSGPCIYKKGSPLEEYTFPFRLGDYVVFDLIGRGGMAEIFLAKQVGPYMESKKVVLKKIHAWLSRIKTFVDALMSEARVMERIRSPFVTQVIDVRRLDGGAFIAMEYVEGIDLNRLLGLFSKHRIPVPEAFIFHVITCVLEGLEGVHQTKDREGRVLDLIHLDLSPGNILISFAGEVKICDFGVATTSELTRIMAREGEMRGKFSYMSPEQAAARPLDRRSDLFSAGIIFWELLSGRKMYASRDMNEVIRMAAEASFPPLPPGRFPDPEKLDAIVARALRKDPADRYPTALEFLDDVAAYVRRRGIVMSQISIGQMLEEHFSDEILQVRYDRERALSALLPVQG